LREGGTHSEDGTFPIDYVDGDDKDKRDADWVLMWLVYGRVWEGVWAGLQRIVEASASGLLPMLVKKGVAGMVRTPARKSLAHPLPPVAEAEYGP
jgi:hypothetical protein